MATYDFGVASSGGQNFLMQSASRTPQADVAEARDSDGNVAAVKFYNKSKERNYEAIIPTGTTEPDIGDVVEYESEKFYVTSASVTETNTDYTRMALGLKRYTANSLPATT